MIPANWKPVRVWGDADKYQAHVTLTDGVADGYWHTVFKLLGQDRLEYYIEDGFMLFAKLCHTNTSTNILTQTEVRMTKLLPNESAGAQFYYGVYTPWYNLPLADQWKERPAQIRIRLSGYPVEVIGGKSYIVIKADEYFQIETKQLTSDTALDWTYSNASFECWQRLIA